MQLTEAYLATVSKYVEPILKEEKALGTDICSNPSTKQQIKQYLTEVEAANIQSLSRD